jgi:phage terminase large subunit
MFLKEETMARTKEEIMKELAEIEAAEATAKVADATKAVAASSKELGAAMYVAAKENVSVIATKTADALGNFWSRTKAAATAAASEYRK